MESLNPLASDLDVPLFKARLFHIHCVGSSVNAPKDDATKRVEIVKKKKPRTSSARGLLVAVGSVALKVFDSGRADHRCHAVWYVFHTEAGARRVSLRKYLTTRLLLI